MSRYSDRLSAATYGEDEPVEIRCHRSGPRGASVYREHVVPERLFDRALLVARAYDLHVLGALDAYGPHRLNKQQAAAVEEETGFLLSVVSDQLLVGHLKPIQELATWCVRSPGDAWLTIEGP